MLYCPQCNKNVDFNSTNISRPTHAFTLDVEGPIDPTIIRSKSSVVNLCKNCGNEVIYTNKSAYNKALIQKRKADEQKSKDDKIFSISFWIASPIAFLLAVPIGRHYKHIYGNGLPQFLASWIILTLILCFVIFIIINLLRD